MEEVKRLAREYITEQHVEHMLQMKEDILNNKEATSCMKEALQDGGHFLF